MVIVDTHVHVALHTYEPVEMLLTQMSYNGVEKAVLVQSSTTTDNTYIIECLRRFPSRFSLVCRVNVASPHALDDLVRWNQEGAESLRLRNFDRSPGGDPLAVWRKAAELGMPVSVGGLTEAFASAEFSSLVESLPDLKIVIEHLGGMGIYAINDYTDVRPADSQFRQVLQLARYPNTYIKIHGMGEFCPPPFPYREIAPYVQMAYDAFGPQRMMWGSDYPRVVLRRATATLSGSPWSRCLSVAGKTWNGSLARLPLHCGNSPEGTPPPASLAVNQPCPEPGCIEVRRLIGQSGMPRPRIRRR